MCAEEILWLRRIYCERSDDGSIIGVVLPKPSAEAILLFTRIFKARLADTMIEAMKRELKHITYVGGDGSR